MGDLKELRPAIQCIDVLRSILTMKIIIIIIIIIAIEFSPGGSRRYTSTNKINKNKIHINETMQRHRTNNTKHSKYKFSHFFPQKSLPNGLSKEAEFVFCAVGTASRDLYNFSVCSGLNKNYTLYSSKVWITFNITAIAGIALSVATRCAGRSVDLIPVGVGGFRTH